MFGVVLGKIYASGLQGGAPGAAAGLGEVVGEGEHSAPVALCCSQQGTQERCPGEKALV